jgi:hypothetical protein
MFYLYIRKCSHKFILGKSTAKEREREFLNLYYGVLTIRVEKGKETFCNVEI